MKLMQIRLLVPMAMLLLAGVAMGQAVSSLGDAGAELSNGSIRLDVSPDGQVSAWSLATGAPVRIVSAALPAVLDEEGKNILEGITPTLALHDVDTSTEQEDPPPHLGPGKTVEATYTSKLAVVRARYSVYDRGRLFACQMFVRAGTKELRVQRVVSLAGRLYVGPGEVRLLSHPRRWESGVSVLNGPARSVFCSAVYNPDHRMGVVMGAISADTASVVNVSAPQAGEVPFELTSDYSGPGSEVLIVPPNVERRSCAFAVLLPTDILAGLDSYGQAVQQFSRVQRFEPLPAGWSSAGLGWAITPDQVISAIEALRKLRLPASGMNVMVLDNGWQSGWRCSGDWTPSPTRFENGLGEVLSAANSSGLRLGLWTGPLFDEDFKFGEPSTGKARDDAPPALRAAEPMLINEPRMMVWQADRPSGAYDLSLPEFQKHLLNTFRRLSVQYGARYVEADQLVSGWAVDRDRNWPFYDMYRRTLWSMRSGLVKGGCLAAGLSFDWFGLDMVDAQRVAADATDWKSLETAGRVASARFFTNGRLWWLDAGRFELAGGTDDEGKAWGLPLQTAQGWATVMAMIGGVTINIDPPQQLSEERAKLLRQTLPPTGRSATPIDLFDVLSGVDEARSSSVWVRTVEKDFGRYRVAALINWTDLPQARRLDLSLVGFSPTDTVLAYDFWQNTLLGQRLGKDVLELEVPAQSCRLIVLQPMSGQVQWLASDRHIVTGEVDVRSIKYDSKSERITGKSASLVPNESYTYTFFVPDGRQVTSASFGGRPANIDRPQRNLARVNFRATRGEMDWTIQTGQ